MGTREKLEAKMNEPPKPALEVVRLYLRGIADIDRDDEIQRGLDRMRERYPRGLAETADAIDTVLADTNPPGLLSRLVGWDGNYVLDDPSDEGAAAWLRKLAAQMRATLNQKP